MNADRLLALYDRVADAPDAVSRLRSFVLDLAVRGKLVEQDPTDEPASDLLKRITATKARLVRIGNIRKPKPSTPIDRTEVPFEVPIHWTWIRLGDIGTLAGGMTPSKNRPEYWDGTVTWLSPKDIRADAVSDSELKITEKALSDTRLKVFPVGSLFMVARSGILKRTFPVAINRVPATSNQDLKVLVPFLKGQERYLQIMFRGLTTFILKDLVKTGTTVQSLKYAEFEVQPIPLPPLAEQHRIVAKVDELMALCDRLEGTRTAREDTRDRLTKASYSRLNEPETDAATFHSHARFAVDALPTLTARADQVKHLRQTIRNLAMRGKLVEQDPAEGFGQDLHARITSACLSYRRTGSLSEAIEDMYPLPASWTWARLGDLVVAGPRNGLSPRPSAREDAPRAVTLTATTSGIFDGSHFKQVDAAIGPDSEFWLQPNDLLFQRGNTREYVGMAAIYDGPPGEFIYPDLMIRVRLSPEVNLRFVHLFCVSPVARSYFSENATGAQKTMPKINQTILRALPIPLPPLAEQRRIVAKVAELMTLCDHMEAGLAAADGTRSRLLESLLHDALASAACAFAPAGRFEA